MAMKQARGVRLKTFPLARLASVQHIIRQAVHLQALEVNDEMPPRGQGRGGPSRNDPAQARPGGPGAGGARAPLPRRASDRRRRPEPARPRGAGCARLLAAVRVGSVAPGCDLSAARPTARWGRGATATGRRSRRCSRRRRPRATARRRGRRPRRAPSPPRCSTPPPRRSRRSAASPAASGSGARAVSTSMASRWGSLDGARWPPLRRPSLRQVRTQRLRCLPTGLLSPRRRRG